VSSCILFILVIICTFEFVCNKINNEKFFSENPATTTAQKTTETTTEKTTTEKTSQKMK